MITWRRFLSVSFPWRRTPCFPISITINLCCGNVIPGADETIPQTEKSPLGRAENLPETIPSSSPSIDHLQITLSDSLSNSDPDTAMVKANDDDGNGKEIRSLFPASRYYTLFCLKGQVAALVFSFHSASLSAFLSRRALPGNKAGASKEPLVFLLLPPLRYYNTDGSLLFRNAVNSEKTPLQKNDAEEKKNAVQTMLPQHSGTASDSGKTEEKHLIFFRFFLFFLYFERIS